VIERETIFAGAAGERQAVPILMYHSVSRHATGSMARFTVSPSTLDQQISYLRGAGYTPVTVSQFANVRQELPERRVILTFDDGFADFHQQALPVLARHGFCATLYLLVGRVGGVSDWQPAAFGATLPMLGWSQVREAQSNGIEISSHGLTHAALDLVPHDQARREIVESRLILQERLGRAVDSFAYPFGYHTPALCRMVREAGYSSACGVEIPVPRRRDAPYALPRIEVHNRLSLEELARRLDAFHRPAARWGRQARSLVWTIGRRTFARRFSPREAHGVLSE